MPASFPVSGRLARGPLATRTGCALALLATTLLAACAPLQTVPQVMVYPGPDKSLADFDADDAYCRSYAGERVGSPGRAANDATIGGAAIGTLLGGAAGAALGAAAGNPAMGAAAGAGVGLLGGTSVGAANGQAAAWSAQREFDVAYAQCMVAYGNEIPRRRAPRRPPLPDYGPDSPPPYGPPPYGPPPYGPPPYGPPGWS